MMDEKKIAHLYLCILRENVSEEGLKLPNSLDFLGVCYYIDTN